MLIREMARLVVLLSLFLLTTAERQGLSVASHYRVYEWIVFNVLFTIFYFHCKDLSGKMFTFPVESNTHHVVLTPGLDKIMFTVSVCLRSFSDISRAQSLFSLSLPSTDNGFLIFKSKQGVYELYVLGATESFLGLQDEPNVWNSICATWDASTGLSQLWVNGIPSSRKGNKAGSSLMGTPKIILGQEQDTYGGNFDSSQSFVGMLTDVHMWDSVLSPAQIAYYTSGGQFQPGNVLNWNSLEFTKNGNVVVESKETSYKVGSF